VTLDLPNLTTLNLQSIREGKEVGEKNCAEEEMTNPMTEDAAGD
jgi:hypothetical protein